MKNKNKLNDEQQRKSMKKLILKKKQINAQMNYELEDENTLR